MCILPQILESHDALCQPGKHRHSSPEGEHLPFPLQKFRCAHGCRGAGVVVVAALAVVAMAVLVGMPVVVVAYPELGAAVVAFAKIAVDAVVIAAVVVDVVALAVLDDVVALDVLDDTAVDVDVRRAGYTHRGQK